MSFKPNLNSIQVDKLIDLLEQEMDTERDIMSDDPSDSDIYQDSIMEMHEIVQLLKQSLIIKQ